MTETPQREGFFWAKWRLVRDGTDTCPKCGEITSDYEKSGTLIDEWEVVRVVHNGGEPGNDEEWMVEVPGVSRWQSTENFHWGAEVTR